MPGLLITLDKEDNMEAMTNLVDLILRNHVKGWSVLDDICGSAEKAAEVAACEGVTITGDQEKVIVKVLSDGAITKEEKALLGFLPSTVVSGIAGVDGKKPARMKAQVLINELNTAEPGAIPNIVKELQQLDPVTRTTVEPEVKKTLAKIQKEKPKAVARFEKKYPVYERLLIQYHKALFSFSKAGSKYVDMGFTGYEDINRMDLDPDGIVFRDLIRAHKQKIVAYYNAQVRPKLDRFNKLRDQVDAFKMPEDPLPIYNKAIDALNSYYINNIPSMVLSMVLSAF